MNPQTYSRRRCGQWLGCLTLLAFAGCATRPAHVARAPNAARTGGEIALFALSLLDMPYVSGGRGAATGFDCSGLVSHVYLQAAGIALRGSAASMAKAARPVTPADLGLSARQGEILALVLQGLPNKRIALQLNIAESTVKEHVTGILERLRVRTRVEAITLLRGRRLELS